MAILPWIIANWRWALPALVALSLGAWVGVDEIIIAKRNATIAGFELEKQKEVAEALRLQKQAHEEDEKANEALVNSIRLQKAAIAKDLKDAQAKLAATASSKVCIGTDAARAYSNGVRRPPDPGQASPVQPGQATGRADQR